jgi:glucuronate isomerase
MHDMKKTPPRTFITDDFLLENPVARRLYHDHAEALPIVDYHNHLPPQAVAEDQQFANLTQIWLAGDHYKWRAMRTWGVPERFITGDASDEEKFARWADTVPATLRNPLYHWTHLELKKPFGLHVLLNPDTAKHVWKTANARLATPAFSVRGLLRQANVEVLCTTDDPADDLRWHQAAARDRSLRLRLLPSFRPDAALGIEAPATWNAWLDRLAAAADTTVNDWSGLLLALNRRCDVFHQLGGRLSDHGLEQAYADPCPPETAATLFRRARRGETLGVTEVRAFRSALLFELGLMYAARDWTQQFHLGALRNVNTGLMQQLGRDCGCDVIGGLRAGGATRPHARPLEPRGQAGPDHPLQPEPARQRGLRRDVRRLPGRLGPRQNPVRQRLVVPRSAGRDGKANRVPLQPRACSAVLLAC